jgi:acetylornithine deacetylase/succinyl-diaminopimelate desuccinylase-like protein
MLPSLTEQLLDLACAVQQIPAPTFHERARAEFVRDQFAGLGLRDVEMDEMENVVARRPGGPPSASAPGEGYVLVTAHTDTVFPLDVPLTLERTPERITGPGIGDNALGVAGLCALAWALEGEDLPGDVVLAANVGEEGLGDLRGMRRVVERFGDRARAIVVLEGMALGHLYHAAIGVRRYRFTARSEGGHSYLHFGRPSAIHALVRFGARLTDLVVPQSPKTTFNIGMISGGTSINTIAREASLDLDLRSEDPATLAALAARVEELAASFDGQGVQMERRLIGNRPSGSIPRDHPLVRLAAHALEEVGIEYTYESGSTDANIPLSRGLPCVCLGLARGGNAHRPDEYIETRDVERGLRALVNVVRGALALA